MQRLAYWLIYPILLGISKLPFPLLYAFSDFCFLIVFYVIRYRKNVVWSNLKLAFPEKEDKELKRIEKAFYHHFCDTLLEMVKTISISEKQLKKRFVIINPEEMRRIETIDKSNVYMYAHYASYEWTLAFDFYNKFETFGVYKKVKNPYFDKLVQRIRGRFGASLANTKEIPRVMMQNKVNKVYAHYGMIADQAPKGGKSPYWRPFMGVETPVFVGTEILTKRLNLNIHYTKIEKVKRGHYEATILPIATNTKDIENYKITDKYFEYLEAQIRKKPEHYLWTHKRWKHKKED